MGRVIRPFLAEVRQTIANVKRVVIQNAVPPRYYVFSSKKSPIRWGL